jgi:hypothetical protein
VVVFPTPGGPAEAKQLLKKNSQNILKPYHIFVWIKNKGFCRIWFQVYQNKEIVMTVEGLYYT